MRATRLILALLLLALAAGGCLELNIPDGFKCSTKDECPSPYSCDKTTHTCKRAGANPDGGKDAPVEQAEAPAADADAAPDQPTENPDAEPDTVVEAGPEAGTEAGAVETGCPTGQHKCAGACVLDDSVDHCGPVSCDKCVPPTGATPTCDAKTCGFTCGAGTKACKDKCIATAACCSDNDCPPQNGKVGKCDTSTNACNYACDTGMKPCAGGCIPMTGCCVESDCPGVCQTCASNKCAAVVSKDDIDSCKGTCDASSACKSKQGQACATAAAGCVTGTTCADGVCCNTACTESCKACDLATSPGVCAVIPTGTAPHGARSCGTGACAGSCTGATSGACTYPTTACGTQSCTGTSLQTTGTCSAGSCNLPAATACPNGFACGTNVCKTTCASDADCAADHFCGSNGKCILDATFVGAGGNHTCVVLKDGSMRCWGYNSDSQLGNNGFSDSPTPVVVMGLGGAKATMVAAGRFVTCAIITGGTVRCWGENAYGEAGDPSLEPNRDASTPVPDVAGATAVSVGDAHVCALLTGGTVKCWGNNYGGQIGNNTTGMAQVPATVLVANGSPLTNVVSISAGGSASCAVLASGAVWCWGNILGTTNQALYAQAVGGVTGATAIDNSTDHACALVASGGVRCWGKDDHGQLGDNNVPGASQASGVPLYANLAGFVSLSVGADSTCGVRTDGTGRCWGSGVLLGSTSPAGDLGRPVVVPGLTNASSVSMGYEHACALLANGSVQCWGAPGTAALGTTNPSAGPTPLPVMPW